MSALAGAGVQSTATPSGTAHVAETNSTYKSPADRGQNAPSDTKSDRLSARYHRRGNKAPVGKRYRASVKQHQRHAAKARNKKG